MTARELDQLKADARLAYEDFLTGLPNRRAFMRELDRRRRGRRRMAVLLLDLDGFKQVNDEYGHDAGDATLRYAAKRIRSRLRTDDYVARLGGDEFAVLIRASDLEGAAKRLRRPLRQAGLPTVGVSVGGAAGSTATAIKRADRRMYSDKRSRAA